MIKFAASAIGPSVWEKAVVLLACSLVAINNLFAYHAPSAVADQFEDKYELSNAQFSSLFTIYSAPNVVLVFFSGIFIDKYGLRTATMTFNIAILLGMLISAMTPYPSEYFSPVLSFFMLLLGRLFLGLGGESIYAASSTMVSRWFTPTGYINTALAVNQGLMQFLGSSGAFFILARCDSLVLVQWVVVCVCIVSLLANWVFNHFDMKYDEWLAVFTTTSQTEEASKDNVNLVELEAPKSILKLPNSKTALKAGPPGAPPANYQALNDTEPEIEDTSHLRSTNAQYVQDVIKNLWRDSYATLGKFSTLFWLILIHSGFVSPILYTFTIFGPLYLEGTLCHMCLSQCIHVTFLQRQ
jgi:MFS family permease